MKTLHFIWALCAMTISGAVLWLAGVLLALADAALKRGDKLYWKPRRYPTRYLRLATRAGAMADICSNWSRSLTSRSHQALEASRE